MNNGNGVATEGARLSASDNKKHKAFDNVIGSINNSTCLPEQVFQGNWNAFLFFESDRLFASNFTLVAKGLLNEERADVCCLLNFNETDVLTYGSAATLFIDAQTSPQAYDAMLRQGGPAKGWMFGMDRYGIASDRGGWSIYCEKENDVAIIALSYPSDKEKYSKYLKQLHAEPIMTLLNASSSASVPFGQLVEPWRHSLVKHF